MSFFKKISYRINRIFHPNRSRTVRFAFPILVSTVALLGALTASVPGGTFIYIESNKTSIRANETFTIDVYVSAEVPVNAVDISLKFPPDQIEIMGIDTGESVITLWTVDPFIENDVVVMRGGTFRKGFVGEHLIATINAKATETGLAQFNISDSLLLAGDGSGTAIDVSDNGSETVKLYIAKEDGTFTQTEGGSSISGNIEISIITDIDGDGKVTLADVSRFMSAWRLRTSIFDFNGDGRMSFRDFGIILYDSFIK